MISDCRRARNVRAAWLASTALAIVAVSSPADADGFDRFNGLGTLGGSSSTATGVSADGAVVVGNAQITGNAASRAFRWSGGAMTDLGTLGGSSSYANGVSADGTVVVGEAYTAGDVASHAVRWSGGTMTDLGTLGGSFSYAYGVSADGAVVVGGSYITGDAAFRAFRWSGGAMTDLGTLGGTTSSASAVSADGAVVVGTADITGNTAYHAFRWSGGAMTDLGTLGGTNSIANGVSADGAVVVGEAKTAGNVATHAFRWSGGTMTDLGTLGGTNSFAYGVSASGAVVVGASRLAGNVVTEAFRWAASTGMQSIPGLLTAAGVNIVGWRLTTATGVSADGTVIVGEGTNPSGKTEAWIARCSSVCSGLLSYGNVAQSFAGQAAMGMTANAALGGTLGTMTEYATQAKRTQGGRNAPFSVFGYAAYDSDPVASGMLGMTVDLPRDIFIGASVAAHALKTDMVFNGSAKMSGASAGAFIARVPDAGPQWLLGIGGTTMKGDVTRGYLNGNDPAASKGSTSGHGVGATARVGWSFNDLLPKTQLTPFASYTIATTRFDGYTETGGPFPARLDGFTATAQTSRIGADARYTFAPRTWLWGTAAWAHRIDGGKTPDISGTIIGLFSMSAPGIASAKDWAELTGGVRLPVWNNGAITASLTTSLLPRETTTYLSRLGFTQAF